MECSICRGIISSEEEIKTCESCKNNFHLDCWTENGGCGTPGCINLPKVDTKHAEAKKICPACGEKIDISESVCPYCNERFDTLAPITVDDLRKRPAQFSEPEIKGKKETIALLIFSLLGITAPFALVIGGIWYNENKGYLKENGPIYNTLAKVGLSISCFYCILIFISLVSK